MNENMERLYEALLNVRQIDFQSLTEREAAKVNYVLELAATELTHRKAQLIREETV